MSRQERFWDEQIRGALKERAGEIKVSQGETEQACRKIHRRIEEETGMRKKWSWKKVLVTAAAVCVVGSVTAIAAGRIVEIESHSSWKEAVNQYSEAQKMGEELNLTLQIPENFSNGYTFQSALPVHASGQDEEGNAVKEWTGMNLIYQKEGQPDLTIDMEQMQESEGYGVGDETFEYNGIRLVYSKEHYRFVPPEYQVSEEEQAQMDAGELIISYGSPEVQDSEIQSLNWQADGISYGLMIFDSTITPAELVQMAEEIIGGNGQ
ncbi:MAG: DUF4179 domain-containing protein [Lachnospiraceae bacterium]|nr:DUF4179 domain-containing protein [Lachnospiraceae bacterium]